MLAKVVLFGSLVSCSTLADVHGLTQQREREREGGGRECGEREGGERGLKTKKIIISNL